MKNKIYCGMNSFENGSVKKKSQSCANDRSVEFLCKTVFGRFLLKIILFIRIPKVIGFFLRSPFSHFMIKKFVKKNQICMDEFAGQKFISFNDFFTRKKKVVFDGEKNHLISPCDSFLSVYKINENAVFHIKGFDYSLYDFFGLDEESRRNKVFYENDISKEKSSESDVFSLIERFKNGDCLVFRLCTTDYHRYHYIDDGIQGENHYIEGSLYSVQPAACEAFRVYAKNRRSWTVMECKNFGCVVQVEIGAFSVGGIKNLNSGGSFAKGDEKGYFDLYGSTVVLLFEPEKIELLPEIRNFTKNGEEFKVNLGEQIGVKVQK